MKGPARKSIEERFWPKVNKNGTDGCWFWTASTNSSGYGQIGLGGHDGPPVAAHRVSWEIHNGPIPEGNFYGTTLVCHHCDEPLCVNPDHLFLGTQFDNMRDASKKGRMKNPAAKLNDRSVGQIRSHLATGKVRQDVIAAMYGVCQQTISDISTRKTYK